MRILCEIKILPEWEGLMIKELLYDHLNFSRKSLTKIKNKGDIRLNGISLFVTGRVATNDLLTLYVPEEQSETVPPEPVSVDIIYEDIDIVIINKQTGVVVHPTRNYPSGTIANGLQNHWLTKGERFRFRPVNRLDRDTSGLFIVAKNQYSHHRLAQQLESGQLKRIYHGIVHGKLPAAEDLIEAPLARDPEHSVRRIVDFNDKEAKNALTRYRVLAENADFSLVELELLTGRTHQLRAHLAWLGAPLVGDDLYGGFCINANAMKNDGIAIQRQALHAWEIALAHPRVTATGVAEACLLFHAPYPPDLARFREFQFPRPNPYSDVPIY